MVAEPIDFYRKLESKSLSNQVRGHEVDLESGALLAANVQAADNRDTHSLQQTPGAAQGERLREVAADKGCHSNAVVVGRDESGPGSYGPEPTRGWEGNVQVKATAEAKREMVASARGKEPGLQRAEKAERSMALMYDTGGLRRVYLQGHENIRKRLLIHLGGYDPGGLLGALAGMGTPRTPLGPGWSFPGTAFRPILALRTAIWRLPGAFPGSCPQRTLGFVPLPGDPTGTRGSQRRIRLD